jgi:hypothetical protein
MVAIRVIAITTSTSTSTASVPSSTQVLGREDARWAMHRRKKNRTVWAQLLGEKIDR